MFLSRTTIISRLFTMPKQKGPAFYAVRKGRQTGVFATWEECERQVKGFINPRFKKFSTREEAMDFVHGTDEASPRGSSSFGSPGTFEPVGSTAALGKPFSSWKDLDKKRKSTPDSAEDWTPLAANNSTTASSSSDGTPMLSLKKCVANMRKASSQMRNFITEAEDHIAELQTNSKVNSAGPTPAKRARTDCGNREGVTVYTDGACTGNGKLGAKAGIGVYWGPNNPKNISERLSGRQTNNRAEIHAAIRAIQQAKSMGLSEVTVKTDSKFLIESITKWIDGWKRRNWVLSSGGPVKNKEDFVELDAEMQTIKVNWVHVRGHSGEPGNEAADSLAVQGAQMPAID